MDAPQLTHRRKLIITARRFEAARDLVAQHFGIDSSVLVNRSRQSHLTEPRHVLWTVLNVGFTTSYSEIGRLVGRDHSTVISGVNGILHRCATDDELRHEVADLIRAARAAGQPAERAA